MFRHYSRSRLVLALLNAEIVQLGIAAERIVGAATTKEYEAACTAFDRALEKIHELAGELTTLSGDR